MPPSPQLRTRWVHRSRFKMGDLVLIFYVTGLKMQKALRTAQLENCRDSHHNYLPDGSLGQALRSAYFSMLLRHLKI